MARHESVYWEQVIVLLSKFWPLNKTSKKFPTLKKKLQKKSEGEGGQKNVIEKWDLLVKFFLS